jgi:hypothetical protein
MKTFQSKSKHFRGKLRLYSGSSRGDPAIAGGRLGDLTPTRVELTTRKLARFRRF